MSAQLERRGVATRYLDLQTPSRTWHRILALARLSAGVRGRAIVHANDLVTYGSARRARTSRHAKWICHIHHPDFDERTVAWALRTPPARIFTPSPACGPASFADVAAPAR